MSPMFSESSRLAAAQLRRLQSRAITAENPSGERGGGGERSRAPEREPLVTSARGWKVSPSRVVPAGQELELAAIVGQGAVEHIWLTTRPDAWRSLVLRMSWDGQEEAPAVAVPLGDFFCQGWAEYAPLVSEPVVVAPYGGMNCYFPMPFRKSARISLENLGAASRSSTTRSTTRCSRSPMISATCTPAGGERTRCRPDRCTPSSRGLGSRQLCWHLSGGGRERTGLVGRRRSEVLHGWRRHPTICGTGTEDYFGGAWDFEVPGHGYTTYSSSYLGLHQVIRPDGLYRSQTRFGMYRWHLPDPVVFERDLKVTIQDLGWRPDGRYMPRSDDLASVAYWYSEDPAGVTSDLSLDALQVSSLPVRRPGVTPPKRRREHGGPDRQAGRTGRPGGTKTTHGPSAVEPLGHFVLQEGEVFGDVLRAPRTVAPDARDRGKRAARRWVSSASLSATRKYRSVALGISSTRAVIAPSALARSPWYRSLALMSASCQVSAWAYRLAARCAANELLPVVPDEGTQVGARRARSGRAAPGRSPGSAPSPRRCARTRAPLPPARS